MQSRRLRFAPRGSVQVVEMEAEGAGGAETGVIVMRVTVIGRVRAVAQMFLHPSQNVSSAAPASPGGRRRIVAAGGNGGLRALILLQRNSPTWTRARIGSCISRRKCIAGHMACWRVRCAAASMTRLLHRVVLRVFR